MRCCVHTIKEDNILIKSIRILVFLDWSVCFKNKEKEILQAHILRDDIKKNIHHGQRRYLQYYYSQTTVLVEKLLCIFQNFMFVSNAEDLAIFLKKTKNSNTKCTLALTIRNRFWWKCPHRPQARTAISVSWVLIRKSNLIKKRFATMWFFN